MRSAIHFSENERALARINKTWQEGDVVVDKRSSKLHQAATGRDLLGWSDKVGSIEAGKYADLDAVEDDALKDVRTLEQVQWVMKGGAVVQ
ncbi:amidohydrolase family protein [Duganella sp. sic0402]|nr:amidohydrolase family protein [Duganella sp. sic0402]